MSLAAVRLAMMAEYAGITGVTVPQDPLPTKIDDKSILIFPRLGPSQSLGLGGNRVMTYSSTKTVDVEYHRRIPYEAIGSVIADITEVIDIILNLTWGQMSGGAGKFGGTVHSIENVALLHFGALGWNEWTFGARMEVSLIHLEAAS